MKLHRILRPYYGIWMQMLVLSSTTIAGGVSQQQNDANPLLPDDIDGCIQNNCTKFNPKQSFDDFVLRRRKRFIIFPLDSANRFTIAFVQGLMAKRPTGLATFIELDCFYPLPDTIEKWKPTKSPFDAYHGNHHHGGTTSAHKQPDPMPPPVPPSTMDDDSLKMSELPSGDPLNASKDSNSEPMPPDLMEMMMKNMMMNMNRDHDYKMHDDHGMNEYYPGWKDHYPGDPNDYSSASFPFSVDSGSEKLYPTPPPGWVDDDDDAQQMDGNRTTILLPPYHDSAQPNSPSNGGDMSDGGKNTQDDGMMQEKVDSWNNWNRNSMHMPAKDHNRYNNAYKDRYNEFRQPINRYYNQYNNNKYSSYQPNNWNYPVSKFDQYKKWSGGDQQRYWNADRANVRYPPTSANDWYYHHGHRQRRYIYGEMEKHATRFGIPNVRSCILRIMCEVRSYLLPRGVSLLHDIFRVLFTLPQKQHWTDDEYIIEARSNATNCSETFAETCPISILEFLLHSNENNLSHDFKIEKMNRI